MEACNKINEMSYDELLAASALIATQRNLENTPESLHCESLILWQSLLHTEIYARKFDGDI